MSNAAPHSSSRTVPLLDLAAQYRGIKGEVQAAVERVLDTQRFILGPEVEGLEAEIAEYCHCPHGVGVSSGTDALLIALMALDVQPGDEVITTPYTFFATAGAIARLGAKPVFVDIDPTSYNINPRAIADRVTPRTRAVIPVHLYGQCAEMEPIMQMAEQMQLPVIEDAAQAIGAEYRGKRAGSLGQMGCLSFFPSKNLGGAGDGGMVVTKDPALADKLRVLRNHGYRPKYYNKYVGGNFRLDALQAAILRVKFKYLEQWTEKRRRNANEYRRLLAPIADKIQLPSEEPLRRHVYNQFVIRSDRRDDLRGHLKNHGVETEIYYPVPMHLQECFRALEYRAGAFAESERAAAETVALPIYPELRTDDIEYVAQTIQKFFA